MPATPAPATTATPSGTASELPPPTPTPKPPGTPPSKVGAPLPKKTPLFTRQGPPRHETPHFAIWTEPDALDPEELARVAELLEKAFNQASAFLDIEYDVVAKGKIPVLFRSPQGIVGFTTPQMTIVFHKYRDALKSVPGIAMIGEVTHIITGRHEDYLIRHLEAVYLETKFVGNRAYPACGFTLHLQAAALLEDKRLVPIEEIPADLFQWGFKPGVWESIDDRKKAHRFYTESGSFGQYLLERYGVAALNRLRSRPDRAWSYGYGKSLEELQMEWLELLEGVRRQYPARVKQLAQIAQSPDPCMAARVAARR